MSLTPFASRKRALGAAATLSLAVASAGVALAPLADAATAAVTATLSATTGPSAGGNSITMTASAATFITSSAYVEFQWVKDTKTACSAKYTTPVAANAAGGVVAVSSPKFLTAKKAVITVPAGVVLVAPATSAVWQVCVFSSTDLTTSTLITSAAYTIATAPVISSVAPAGGPALGGGQITITGQYLSGNTVVKLGNATLVPTVNALGTQITATVPAQAAGPASDVVVTTTGGTVTSVGAYTYSNGLMISPNTTPTAVAATDIDVSGVGLSKITFSTTTGTTPNDLHGHVYVVAGTYNPTDDGAGNKTLGEVGECLNVLVISDTELICSVNTLHGYGAATAAIPNGTYTLTAVSDGRVDVQTGGANANASFTQSIVSSGSTFTVAPY